MCTKVAEAEEANTKAVLVDEDKGDGIEGLLISHQIQLGSHRNKMKMD